jgi:RNA polymerase sigma factor (sigma-70 family)
MERLRSTAYLDGLDPQALVEIAQGSGTMAKRAKERLLLKHEPLMRQIIKEVRSPAYLYEDALQAARLGCLEALENFDPSRGTTYGTFARQHIRGRVIRAVYAEQERFYGASAWSSSISAESVLIISHDLVAEESPYTRGSNTERDDSGKKLAKTRKAFAKTLKVDSDYLYARLDEKVDLQPAIHDARDFMSRLTDRQQEVIRLVFESGLSQAEAARALGITPAAVNRILARVRRRGVKDLAAFRLSLAA